MKDFLGQDLAVGDWVIYLNNGYSSGSLHGPSKIEGFTPKKIRVNSTIKKPNQVVKIEEEYCVIHFLMKTK